MDKMNIVTAIIVVIAIPLLSAAVIYLMQKVGELESQLKLQFLEESANRIIGKIKYEIKLLDDELEKSGWLRKEIYNNSHEINALKITHEHLLQQLRKDVDNKLDLKQWHDSAQTVVAQVVEDIKSHGVIDYKLRAHLGLTECENCEKLGKGIKRFHTPSGESVLVCEKCRKR